MTTAVQIIPAEETPAIQAIPETDTLGSGGANAPEGWQELRNNSDIQFEEVEFIAVEPVEPGWLADVLGSFFELLGNIFGPIGQFIGAIWPVLQWVLLGLAVVFALYLLARIFGPLAGRNRKDKTAKSEVEWQPDEEESTALLEDADKLAAEGRYDEAVHLLLQRSVGQIAQARPEWVEPSSTARELVALPSLSEAARAAFSTISERVERSLFALRALDREDWEKARSAYAKFALSKIEGNYSATALKASS